jgi:hypothetical protein
MRKNILLTVSLLTLVGCGGGGASVTPKVLEILTTTVTEIVFGETRVIDGYVSGAEVFIDYNWNLVRDEGEPLATEDTTNNIYSFNSSDTSAINNWSEQCANNRPKVANVPVGAYDSDRGYVNDAYTMYFFPPKYNANYTVANVTPFTTLFTGYVTEDLNQTITVADGCGTISENVAQSVLNKVNGTLQTLSNQFDIDVWTFYDDYIASEDTVKGATAERIVDFLTTTSKVEQLLESQYNYNMTTVLSPDFVNTIMTNSSFSTVTFTIMNVSDYTDQSDDWKWYRVNRYQNITANHTGQILDSNNNAIPITLENIEAVSDIYTTETYESKSAIFNGDYAHITYENNSDYGQRYVMSFGQFIDDNVKRYVQTSTGRELSVKTPAYQLSVSLNDSSNTYFTHDLASLSTNRDTTSIQYVLDDINSLYTNFNDLYQNQYLLYGADSQTKSNNNWFYQEWGSSGINSKCVNTDTSEEYTGTEAYNTCIQHL